MHQSRVLSSERRQHREKGKGKTHRPAFLDLSPPLRRIHLRFLLEFVVDFLRRCAGRGGVQEGREKEMEEVKWAWERGLERDGR
jgi:hypothetical protein